MKITLNSRQIPELARPAVENFLQAHYPHATTHWDDGESEVTVLGISTPDEEFEDLDFILASIATIIEECNGSVSLEGRNAP